MVAFPCKNSAPVKGFTLSTRVGRLSRTHFELGISVNAISRGKEWLNGKVESQRNCRCLNKWFSHICSSQEQRCRAISAAAHLRWGKVLGSIMRKTMEPTKQQQGGPVESLC